MLTGVAAKGERRAGDVFCHRLGRVEASGPEGSAALGVAAGRKSVGALCVSKEGLNVRVDNDTLLIECEANLDMPEGMQAVYAEVRTPHFRRSFALSGELDAARIDAKLKDGVLTVTIPKTEAAKPHRIEVRSG